MYWSHRSFKCKKDPIVSGLYSEKGAKKGPEKNDRYYVYLCTYNIPHTGLIPLTYNCPVGGSGLYRGTVVSNSRIRKKDHFPRNYGEDPFWDLLVKILGVVSYSRIREFVKFTRGVYSEGSPRWGWNSYRLGCGFESHPGYTGTKFTNSWKEYHSS